ncbi:hypothetical protein WCLP8_1380008 [uncultured Gammaproteobacteria bacterium]
MQKALQKADENIFGKLIAEDLLESKIDASIHEFHGRITCSPNGVELTLLGDCTTLAR